MAACSACRDDGSEDRFTRTVTLSAAGGYQTRFGTERVGETQQGESPEDDQYLDASPRSAIKFLDHLSDLDRSVLVLTEAVLQEFGKEPRLSSISTSFSLWRHLSAEVNATSARRSANRGLRSNSHPAESFSMAIFPWSSLESQTSG